MYLSIKSENEEADFGKNYRGGFYHKSLKMDLKLFLIRFRIQRSVCDDKKFI